MAEETDVRGTPIQEIIKAMDGAELAAGRKYSECEAEDIYKLKLIDFANVYTPGSSSEESEAAVLMRNTPDEDLIRGVTNLLSLLQALLNNPNILDEGDPVTI